MNQSKLPLQWATNYLSKEHLTVQAHKKIVETSYSIVHKIETNECTYYLKQVPESLFLEPKTLAFLTQHGCTNIPKAIAQNNELHCFLMTSVGDSSLRHLFKGHVNLAPLIQGISNFTDIQRSLEDKVQALLDLGTPDWRLNRFPSLYSQLIEQDKLLQDDGLTEQEIDHLQKLRPTCINLCEALSKYKIPETINHCDFQENNMLLDNKSGSIGIIDWGEAVISHPFFSLSGCLWNITFFNDLGEKDDAFKILQSQCVSPWLDLHGEEALLTALGIANKLNGIFAALGYQMMYEATKNLPRTAQQEHPGSIAGCLRSFINCAQF
ncbi:aminoglycoside phosphotransferase family protein [Legionella sp. W05-934-2]|uniref:aminoglycoside phosphotransferase family protein n=1 Tax=Legionella sp. W05-934-2 TaxID=1198649 RepID=UPI003461E71D